MSFQGITTFGSTVPNPFLVTQGATITTANNSAPLPPAPPVGPFAPAGTAPAAGVAYANGITINKVHDLGMGKQLAECVSNPAGKKIWIDLQLSPEAIPATIVAGLTNNNTVFSEFDTPSGALAGMPNATINLPIPNTNPAASLVMKEFGQATYYEYLLTGIFGSDLHYAANRSGYALPGTIYAPDGRGRFYLQQGAPFNITGGTTTQTFSSQAAAQAYATANNLPATAIFDKSVTATKPNVSAADLQGWLNQQWEIASQTSKWLPTEFNNIEEGSTEYDNIVAQNPSYKFVRIGHKTVLVSEATAEIKKQNLTQAQADAFEANYPNAVVTQNGTFPATTVTFNNNQKIVVGSDLYKQLQAEGWTFKPADPLVTNTPMVVATKTKLTAAEKDALLALNAGWKVSKTYNEPYSTSSTVKLTIPPDKLAEYQAKYPNLTFTTQYKTIPGTSTTETKHVENQDFGLWMEAMNKDDGAETFSSSEAAALMEDEKYRTTSPFGLPTQKLSDSIKNDKSGTGIKDCDQTAFFGDPFFGAFEDSQFDVHVDPDSALYKLAAGGNDDFCYQWVKEVSEINDNGNKAATGYYLTAAVDGDVHKFVAKNGIIEHIKPDGTKVTISPDETFTLKDSDGRTWVTIDKANAVKAGENQADEMRSRITLQSPPSQEVVTDLLAKGFNKNEIYDKASRKQTMWLGTRLAGGDGSGVYGDDDPDAFVGYNAAHQTAATLASATGVKLYYDAQLDSCYDPGVFTCITQGEPTEEIDSYEICYTETVESNKTYYDLEQIKDCSSETPQVTACKTEPGQPKFDACVPGKEAEYKEVVIGNFEKEEICYDLKKTTTSYCVEVDESLDGYCYNGSSASPLAIDLNGDGVKTVINPNNPWKFDLNADGIIDTMKASLSNSDGFLAWDKNKDGSVNDGAELFGNVTGNNTYADGLAALTDYAETHLAGSTTDKKLSLDEMRILEETADLRIQITDSAGNKVLRRPSELGITELQLSPDPTKENFTDENGVWHGPRTNVVLNGQSADMDDLWFEVEPNADAASTTTSTYTATTTNTSANTATNSETNSTEDEIIAPQRPPNPQPWERNWLYNNPAYGAPPIPPSAPSFGMDPLMMQMMSVMGGLMPNAYGYQQQQQLQMQQQMQQIMMNFYLQALIASLMPQLSSQQYPASAAQQQYTPFY